MAITFYPYPGSVLMYQYPPEGTVEPEMVKPRPVVVISKKLKHRGRLVTIVPLSASQPKVMMPYHIEITINPLLPPPFDKEVNWAICDHPLTASFDKLDRIKIGKTKDGPVWHRSLISNDKLDEIRRGVACAIGLLELNI